jgi:L-ribulokinase
MKPKKGEFFVLGIDFGTDSCRAVVVDAADGKEAGTAVAGYPRWTKGLYCAGAENRFRQHPRDYIESMEDSVRRAFAEAGRDVSFRVRGISIDTTGSTPCAVDAEGVPLALRDDFANNPNAMFVLWKDHTAVRQAARINELARTWGGIDYTRFEGGVYSSEWFWAKIMKVLEEDLVVAKAARSFVEHCDWMPALLTGLKGVEELKRSRCAMGHKAMWHAEFGGYPSDEFLLMLDPRLPAIKKTLGTRTYTSDEVFGALTAEWAGRLGLPAGIPVGVGAYDAHMGAVGGGVKPGLLVKVMGTSTCDMIVGSKPSGKESLVRGICGQVDGSILPNMIGYEAGQSAFGDVYAWFKSLLLWPLTALLPGLEGIDAKTKDGIAEKMSDLLLPALMKAAESVDPEVSGLVALDWLNGRRTPDADQTLKGGVVGLSLGTDAPRFFRALVEATAFGARAIVERFRSEGVGIEGIIGIGGVARKSPFVMQVLADVLGTPIAVAACDQSVALGAAMFAATVAGLYPSVAEAQAAMEPSVESTFTPDAERAAIYDALYARYRAFGVFAEADSKNPKETV